MKKATIITLLLIMICSCAFVFVACDSANDIVGTWENDDTSISFNKDGTGNYKNTSEKISWTYNKKTKKYLVLCNLDYVTPTTLEYTLDKSKSFIMRKKSSVPLYKENTILPAAKASDALKTWSNYFSEKRYHEFYDRIENYEIYQSFSFYNNYAGTYKYKSTFADGYLIDEDYSISFTWTFSDINNGVKIIYDSNSTFKKSYETLEFSKYKTKLINDKIMFS